MSLNVAVVLVSNVKLSLHNVIKANITCSTTRIDFRLPRSDRDSTRAATVRPVPGSGPPIRPPAPRKPTPGTSPLMARGANSRDTRGLGTGGAASGTHHR